MSSYPVGTTTYSDSAREALQAVNITAWKAKSDKIHTPAAELDMMYQKASTVIKSIFALAIF
ncbi:hypothetical protein [Zhongshania aliphaticivorans]|uniref:hypothetical protein n=1 Tax=Zhongshania aliphaticivorans TaxID=1470434 RepID=UPI0013309063|nr:hypothetical protein [Zhongshania aliphaticivorans]